MSELLAIGVSHKTAPVEVRERLALTDARAAEFVRDLHGVPEIQEVVALSTCNRTELYLVVDDPVEAESTVLGMLAKQASIQPTALAPAIYSHRNCEAARHLYRVSAGLESMIIGEDQIQGQVRRAYDAALERETTGPLTNHLFKAALATGKRVRTETAIGAGHMSLPSVSAMLAKEVLGDLHGRRVVIIGTGESSELAARALAEAGGELVFVATRRRDRAVSLADRFGGAQRRPSTSLPEELIGADMVVSATSSPHLLIEAEELAEVQAQRDQRPLLIIDLAVPRDVDAACAAGDRACRCTTSTTSRRWSPATAACARARRARPTGSSRRRSRASPPGSGRSRCCRRSRRCAVTRPRSPRRCSRRTTAGGRPPPSRTSSACRRSPARS